MPYSNLSAERQAMMKVLCMFGLTPVRSGAHWEIRRPDYEVTTFKNQRLNWVFVRDQIARDRPDLQAALQIAFFNWVQEKTNG